MFEIHYTDGKLLGSMNLSERSQQLLDIGEPVTIIYHTPQLLRDKIGPRSGNFELYKEGDQIKTKEPDRLSEFLQLQTAIEAATRNA